MNSFKLGSVRLLTAALLVVPRSVVPRSSGCAVGHGCAGERQLCPRAGAICSSQAVTTRPCFSNVMYVDVNKLFFFNSPEAEEQEVLHGWELSECFWWLPGTRQPPPPAGRGGLGGTAAGCHFSWEPSQPLQWMWAVLISLQNKELRAWRSLLQGSPQHGW